MTPMTSACPGCACDNRAPSRWCSCDPLRNAEAGRDRYRDKALSAECRYRIACGICGSRCDDDDYCDAVVDVVDEEADGE